MYSDRELLEKLKLLTWDLNISADQLLLLLHGEKDQVNGFTRKNLYMKIINGFNWHVARHIIPADKLSEALSDDVINGLFPRTLREKYRYVRALL